MLASSAPPVDTSLRDEGCDETLRSVFTPVSSAAAIAGVRGLHWASESACVGELEGVCLTWMDPLGK